MKKLIFTLFSIGLCLFVGHAEEPSCQDQSPTTTLSPTQLATVEKLGAAFLDLDQYDDVVRKELIRRNNLENPYSYISIVLNDVKGPAYNFISESCRNYLKTQVYGLNESLYAPAIYQAAVPVLDFPYKTGQQDNSFFHYTNSTTMLDQLQGDDPSRFENIFEYLRVKSEQAHALWSTVLYVAEDAHSSSGYGIKRVVFQVSPKAKVIQSPFNQALQEGFPKAMEYLHKKFPGLKDSCKESLLGDRSKRDYLRYLIFEDSGIGLVSYYDEGAHLNQHFQVISPSIFEDAELHYELE